VPFEVNGLLRLTGRSAKNDNKGYREEVKGITVARKFARLHVLHIVSYNTSQESPYARITMRYADGSVTSWPLRRIVPCAGRTVPMIACQPIFSLNTK